MINNSTGVYPLKSKLKRLSKNGGRNIKGRITVHHQGGGHKQKVRNLDLKMNFKCDTGLWSWNEIEEYNIDIDKVKTTTTKYKFF